MSPFQILIVLICAALGFGIVSNVIGPARKAGPPDDHESRGDEIDPPH